MGDGQEMDKGAARRTVKKNQSCMAKEKSPTLVAQAFGNLKCHNRGVYAPLFYEPKIADAAADRALSCLPALRM